MSIKLPVIDFIVGGKVIAESQSPFDQTHLFTLNRTKIPPKKFSQPKKRARTQVSLIQLGLIITLPIKKGRMWSSTDN
jgi:hypothetical protein